jgi:hypothetical protein
VFVVVKIHNPEELDLYPHAVDDAWIGPHVLLQRLTGNTSSRYLKKLFVCIIGQCSISDQRTYMVLHIYPAWWIGWKRTSCMAPALTWFKSNWHLRTLVYTTPVSNISSLWQWLENSCHIIHIPQWSVECVWHTVTGCAQCCIEAHKGHFQCAVKFPLQEWRRSNESITSYKKF